MAENWKARRQALGLSRADVAQAAYVDKRILQLIELNQSADADVLDRLDRAYTALESGTALPDFKSEVDAQAGQHSTFDVN